MNPWSRIVPFIGVGMVACSMQQSGTHQEDDTGSLALNLIGTDSGGDRYRLRNAEFEINGFSDLGSGEGGASGEFFDVVSSEDDVNAPVITTRVLPGFYNIFFRSDDWFLERITPNGVQPVEQAALLSSRFQGAFVWDDEVSRVNYQFGVDGELIDFRSGDIEIGITIERPEDGQGGSAGFGGSAGEGGGF